MDIHWMVSFKSYEFRSRAKLMGSVSDLGSIILQAIGGGVAAAAGDRGDDRDQVLLDAGNGLIIAGIGFQIATMTVW